MSMSKRNKPKVHLNDDDFPSLISQTSTSLSEFSGSSSPISENTVIEGAQNYEKEDQQTEIVQKQNEIQQIFQPWIEKSKSYQKKFMKQKKKGPQVHIFQVQTKDEQPSPHSVLDNFKMPPDDPFEVYYFYMIRIRDTLDTKVSSQKYLYPNISFQHYSKIGTIWYSLTNEQGTKSVANDKFLKYKHLQRLRPQSWLNDIIIQSYLDLLKAKQSQNQKYRKFVLMNSMQVQSIFSKNDASQINQILTKNYNFNKKSILILAINFKAKHWIFIKVHPPSKTKKYINATIYDSIQRWDIQYYNIDPLTKIKQKLRVVYNSEFKFEICENFPKQKNNSDCGVMMLCGIVDVLEENITWTFSEEDMQYKRALITKQLVEGQIKL